MIPPPAASRVGWTLAASALCMSLSGLFGRGWQWALTACALAGLLTAWVLCRRLAAAFHQLTGQMGAQRGRLGEQTAELERLNAEIDQFATLTDDLLATINHQLRTPLTSVVECLELIRDGALGPISEEQQSFIATMDRNVRQLANLVEEVLDLSLLKSGRRPLDRQPGDLAAVLRRAQERWQHVAHTCVIRLAAPELPLVHMDAHAIEEVLDHLLRNALRHAPPHSEITIKAHARDGVVDISVRDQGPGVPAEQVARLFQPFIHVQGREAPGSQGSGLGLSFCRQVIERHHGVIRADTCEGREMTVTFSLPIATSAFLFTEACRRAQEDAEHESGQFGLLVVSPADSALSPEAARALLHGAEAVLRRHTHRGDQFVWLDELTVAIMAVTDQPGLAAMSARLAGVLRHAELHVGLAGALYPIDGTTPEHLLEAARGVPHPLVRRPDRYEGSKQSIVDSP